MKKQIISGVIIFALFIPASAMCQSGLSKYREPAQITELDWMLLDINIRLVNHETGDYDSYDLIRGARLMTANDASKILVLFFINNDAYLKIEKETMSKVFIGAVEHIFKIIKMDIPEATLMNDIIANYVILYANKQIAVYENGKLKFTP
ncbi:MAG: hypothetical protein LUQ68_06670 [Methylococcaceae bacterium]|nr:hypothetical protein [Methylococcaceae bacterium]